MKRKYDPMIDPRLNHAKSWRDMLPVEPALGVVEPGIDHRVLLSFHIYSPRG